MLGKMGRQLTVFGIGGKIPNNHTMKRYKFGEALETLNLSAIPEKIQEKIIAIKRTPLLANANMSLPESIKAYFSILKKGGEEIKTSVELFDILVAREYISEFSNEDDALAKKAIAILDGYIEAVVAPAEKFKEPKVEKKKEERTDIYTGISELPLLFREFVPLFQQSVIIQQKSEELVSVVGSITDNIFKCPPLYSQDGLGKQAIVYMHYFIGGADIWISEVDKETKEGFGYTILNGDTEMAEFGYTSISEIISTKQGEMDLYWTPKTFEEALKNK
mgnify:CR=1 FL=1